MGLWKIGDNVVKYCGICDIVVQLDQSSANKSMENGYGGIF